MVKTNFETNIDDIKPSLSEIPMPLGLPAGNYCLVGWDMDTTGRRLIDEICQIAAYTQSSQFSQHIMPNGNLKQASRRRHNIRVVTVGRYRVLKSISDNKVLKTKSEIAALKDFISWLEGTKGDAVDGIILIYHEPRKVVPYVLIEALRRYNLLERFGETVKGFANGFLLSGAKCASSMKSYGLRILSRSFFEKEESLESAVDRARLAYQVSQHLCKEENLELPGCSGDAGPIFKDNLLDVARVYTQPLAAESKELDDLKDVIERQKTFRPIFGPMLRTNRCDRQYASLLRRLLAEYGFDYNALNAAYEKSAKAGLEEELSKIIITNNEQGADLLEILDSYFDPKRTAEFPNSTRPVRKSSRGRRDRNKKGSANDSKNDSGTATPDTATSSSSKELASSSVTSSDSALLDSPPPVEVMIKKEEP